MTQTTPRPVLLWLACVYGMVLAMVVVGGITRLTGSGLSMVEWHPLMGTLPPLNDAEWTRVFALYRASPQYQQVNAWMDLAAFQRIFFWEFIHRLLGRLIGLVVFFPAVAFYAVGKLKPPLARNVAIAFVLGGGQGLLGWYMVKSGLVDRPEVSHFRLAAHLLLAFAVGQWLLWTWLGAADSVRQPRRSPLHGPLLAGFTVLLVVQIAYGAFMAGTRAGWLASTFPDMAGHYLPGPFFPDGLSSALDHPFAIHYVHRGLGWLVLISGVALWVFVVRREPPGPLHGVARQLVAVVMAQFLLGALTVIHAVPIPLAVAHQALAYILLSVTVRLWWVGRSAPLLGASATPPRETATAQP